MRRVPSRQGVHLPQDSSSRNLVKRGRNTGARSLYLTFLSNAKWPLQEYLDRVEREAILEALDKTRFNRTAAAKLLGITFRALRYRMERLGIH